jgi:hypothetical protein
MNQIEGKMTPSYNIVLFYKLTASGPRSRSPVVFRGVPAWVRKN